ncbi:MULTISPECIES: ROK family transcriptional regulator [unclassified Butyrivibrio]|uniref:ROK family transcriptional regulator n=1 Tax=unclassified Butyrivibrio TaxID=2639466 RepID=UPI000418EB18|nr:MULTISPECIES: ROK family transcriptional regulator [unclassified Butyrivibrio]SEL40975.1 Sugar kinase of the NBD/HSP70 family, may contain an N-terminal HTH domain [Butyrivibrio sp. ob235]
MDNNPIVNNSDMNEAHRAQLLKIIHQKELQNEICSRAELAKMTGLTQASITKIVASLIESGIVLETGIIKGSGNRRAIGLKLNSEKNCVIGVKFSRYMYTVGLFDISGKFYKQTEVEFDITDDPKIVLKDMKKLIREYLDKNENVVAIGMAVPGPYLKNEGHIAVVSHMMSWHDVNFLKEFENEFDKPFFIEQDANAGAMAEWWFGNHKKPMNTLAYFLMGEGVGSGIVENEKLLFGKQGAASEVGHISIDYRGPRCECGNYGCLELYCSTRVMLARAKEALPSIFTDKKHNRIDDYDVIFEAARKGDGAILDIMKEMAQYIAYGCVTLINAYNPDIIVIGDVISKAGDILLPQIKRIVEERTIPELFSQVDIMMSELSVDPTLYGAAAIATDRVLGKPSEYLTAK